MATSVLPPSIFVQCFVFCKSLLKPVLKLFLTQLCIIFPVPNFFFASRAGNCAPRVALDTLLMTQAFRGSYFISWTRKLLFTRRVTRPMEDKCTHSFLLRCHLSCSNLLGRVTCLVRQKIYLFFYLCFFLLKEIS